MIHQRFELNWQSSVQRHLKNELRRIVDEPKLNASTTRHLREALSTLLLATSQSKERVRRNGAVRLET